jgi:hypothetical protein
MKPESSCQQFFNNNTFLPARTNCYIVTVHPLRLLISIMELEPYSKEMWQLLNHSEALSV